VLGLLLLLVVFGIRPLFWYWDPGRGFAQWLLPIFIFPALAFYSISLEDEWSNLPVQGSSSGLCLLNMEVLPVNRTAVSWARKLLLSIYLIELAVRVSLWVRPLRVRSVASFATGFAAGFAAGWHLAWDTCSLVWLTTSLSWGMGVAACILTCLGIEPSPLEEVAVQKAVLDVAEARQKAHYSRRHLLPLSGMCLCMFLCSAFVILATVIAWACDFKDPAVPHHMHQSTFRPAATTMNVPADTMATTVAPSDASSSFVDLRLQNETCLGSTVNRQFGLEDFSAQTTELCQQLCIESHVCKFVQFEMAYGRCHLYEDCGKLRNCGQPCGRTFKMQVRIEK